jgi:hypothetical protein
VTAPGDGVIIMIVRGGSKADRCDQLIVICPISPSSYTIVVTIAFNRTTMALEIGS